MFRILHLWWYKRHNYCIWGVGWLVFEDERWAKHTISLLIRNAIDLHMLCLDLYVFVGLFAWNNGGVCLCVNPSPLTCHKWQTNLSVKCPNNWVFVYTTHSHPSLLLLALLVVKRSNYSAHLCSCGLLWTVSAIYLVLCKFIWLQTISMVG